MEYVLAHEFITRIANGEFLNEDDWSRSVKAVYSGIGEIFYGQEVTNE